MCGEFGLQLLLMYEGVGYHAGSGGLRGLIPSSRDGKFEFVPML